MPLTAEQIAALDPNNPADAAVLRTEALYYVDRAGALTLANAGLAQANAALVEDNAGLVTSRETAVRLAAVARLEAQAAPPGPNRPSIRLARRG